MQEEYTSLHSKYQEVKAQRIQEVEDVIVEIKAQEQAHTQKALQLAAHWEAEAQRQAAIAQHGDVVALQGRVDEQERQLADLQELLLDTQTQVISIHGQGELQYFFPCFTSDMILDCRMHLKIMQNKHP